MLRPCAIACTAITVVTVLMAAEPRLRPVPSDRFTEEQRSLATQFASAFGSGADFRTLLVHPELVKGVLPFANYILSESTLTARHRELLILRTAWRTQSDYLWLKHQSRALAAGRSRDEVRAIGGGPTIRWDPFEQTLLNAADELELECFVTDETWNALAQRYNVAQLMDATFTVAEMTMIAAVLNSARVPLEDGWTAPELGSRWRWSNTRFAALTRPRIEPVVLAEASQDIRTMLDPSGSGRDIAAVYRTFARHPKLYPPRQILSEYIRTKSTLSPRVREMLILRTGARCRSAYEWAAHAPAGRRAGLTDAQIRMLAVGDYDGWTGADAAIVRAADELFARDTITDETWAQLDDQLDERQLLDVVITAVGYRMVSMALNTFGVPAEPNSEPFPR